MIVVIQPAPRAWLIGNSRSNLEAFSWTPGLGVRSIGGGQGHRAAESHDAKRWHEDIRQSNG